MFHPPETERSLERTRPPHPIPPPSNPRRSIIVALIAVLLFSSSQQALNTYAQDLAHHKTAVADNRTVTGTSDYDVYGNLRASSGTQATEGWAGETGDATTGFIYLPAREYDPLTGRFLTADTESPSGSFTQGFNPYHYTGNNPVTRTDPSGHNWIQQSIEAIGQVSDVIVQMVYLMRDFMRNDDIPPMVKKFVGALLVFGIAIMSMLLEMLIVNVIGWVSGATRTMIGSALYMSRLRVLGTQGRLITKCIGNGRCREVAEWLTKNLDCLTSSLKLASSYARGGVPYLGTTGGLVSATVDGLELASECWGKNVSLVAQFSPMGSPGSLGFAKRFGPVEAKRVGREGEELADTINDPKKRIETLDGAVGFPDSTINSNDVKYIIEVKNVIKQSLTKLIRTYIQWGKENGFKLRLCTDGTLSGPLFQQVVNEVVEHFGLANCKQGLP